MAKTIDAVLLDRLAAQAAASERLRSHYNLHETLEDPIHRFCVSAEPGTAVTPHRHPGKWELTVILRGEIEVQTFDEAGTVTGTYRMAPGGLSVLELDEHTFHRFRALKRSAFLEIKPGPYLPAENASFTLPD